MQKPNVEAEVYDNKKFDWKKKKKENLRSLIGFFLPIKSTTRTEREKWKRKNNPKESTEQVKK